MSIVDAGSVQVRLTANTQDVMKGFEDTIKSLKRIEAQAYQTQKAMTKAIGSAAGAIIANFRNMDTVSTRTTTRIQKEITKTNKFVKDLSIRFNQLYRTMFNIKTIAIVMFGGMVKSLSDTTAEVERMRASLNVLTGGRGEDAFNALSSFAARTNITTAEAVKQYTQLRAVGLQPTIEDMETLLDLTNAFGGSTAVFQRISKALGDIQAKGKLMGEEVRQLTNIGIPIRQILVDSGALSQNMVDQIGKANVSASKTFQALFDYVKTNFKGITNEIMDTWAGTVERLEDTWWRWKRVVAETGFMDALKNSTDRMVSSNTMWLATLESLGRSLKVITETLSSNKMSGSLAAVYGIVKSIEISLKMIAHFLEGIYQLSENTTQGVGDVFLGNTASTIKYYYIQLTKGKEAADAYMKTRTHISQTLDALKKKEQNKKLLSIWEGTKLDPTSISEETKKIMGTSKEMEEMLNVLSKQPMGSANMFTELQKNVDSIISGSVPKIEKMKQELQDLKDSYNNLYGPSGSVASMDTQLKDSIAKESDSVKKTALETKLLAQREQAEEYRLKTLQAIEIKEKQIANEEAKSLRLSVGLFSQIEKKYEKLVGLKQTESQTTGVQLKQWGEQLAILAKKKPQLIDDIEVARTQLNEIKAKLEEPWVNKLSDGFKLAAENIMDLEKQMQSFATSITTSLTDAFTDFFDKGKADWNSFLQSVRTMILKILVEQTITGPLAKSMSSVLGQSSGVNYNNLINAVTSMFGYEYMGGQSSYNPAVSPPVAKPNVALANGGVLNEPVYGYGMNSGKSYLMGEAGSEAVVPLDKLGSNSTNVTVNLYGGDENTKVEQRQGQNGPEIDIYLDRKMAQLVSGGSATAKALKASYGLKQRRY